MEMVLETYEQKLRQILIIQSRAMIFKVLINFLSAALSGGTLLQYVMSQQYNCLMELHINFHTIFTFHENVSSPYC